MIKNKTYDILFLADAQDIWIFNYFLIASVTYGRDLVVVYKPSGKITSPTESIRLLKNTGINPAHLISYNSFKDNEFDTLIDGCRWFITKDFLPFFAPTKHIDKFIVVSWVGESLNRTHDKPWKKTVQPGYRKLYVEKSIVPVYNHLNHEASSPCPKYFFLHGETRDRICQQLSLDPKKKYVTVFSNVYFDNDASAGMARDSKLNDRVSKIYDHIVSYCKANDLVIILKNKMKYGNAFAASINHDFFSSGVPTTLWHPGLSLLAVSEFSVGMATSASVEAEELGARFISFWKDPYRKVDDSLYENIVGGTLKNYRLSQEQNTCIINTNDTLDSIIEPLNTFMKNSSHVQQFNFPIDEFLLSNFGENNG